MKKIRLILVTVLAIFNLCLIYRYSQLKQTSTLIAEEYSQILVKEERVSQKLKAYSIYQHAMEGVDIPDIMIRKENNDSLSLSSLIDECGGPILCFRFKDSHCDACIQHAIRMLHKISTDIPQQIVILSGYTNLLQFKAFESSQKRKLTTYNIEDIPCWDIDAIEQSYFFVLKGDKIHNVFIPLKEDNNYTQDYIHTLMHRYWK